MFQDRVLFLPPQAARPEAHRAGGSRVVRRATGRKAVCRRRRAVGRRPAAVLLRRVRRAGRAGTRPEPAPSCSVARPRREPAERVGSLKASFAAAAAVRRSNWPKRGPTPGFLAAVSDFACGSFRSTSRCFSAAVHGRQCVGRVGRRDVRCPCFGAAVSNSAAGHADYEYGPSGRR